MQTNEVIATFEALAEAYGLPKDNPYYYELQDEFVARKEGLLKDCNWTYDNSVLEGATMLKQILRSKKGFKIGMDAGAEYYQSEKLRGGLTQFLVAYLNNWIVRKFEGGCGCWCFLLESADKGGVDDDNIAFEFEIKGYKPQLDGGFSVEELDMITGFISTMDELQNKIGGNKSKDKMDANAPKTYLPYLGCISSNMFNKLPSDWVAVEKYNFIADYYVCSGTLDYRGGDWLSRYFKMTRQEKDRMVRDWIKGWDKFLRK